MRSVWVSATVVLALMTTILVGCDKENAPTGTLNTTTPVGGIGGTASLIVTPMNKGLNIDSCYVFIKYDAPVIPADLKFDDTVYAVKNVHGIYTANFTQLKEGEYYLYGVGWDNVRSERVRGGLPYVVSDTSKSTEHTIILDVKQY